MIALGLFGDQDLAAAVVAEDDLETAGLLNVNDRRTCHACRMWIAPGHTASPAHEMALQESAVLALVELLPAVVVA
jgi:hypothetical protein